MTKKRNQFLPRIPIIIVAPMKKGTLSCLAPECFRVKRVRGLCDSCYTQLHKLVKSGAISWEQAETEGKCLPKLSKELRNKRLFDQCYGR